ncbi:hypothetical protein OEZ86_010089 [Tetradesmus obliquus]|uniref:Major facilitator superfamily (MFS) profile domain-containing protein n=1 Tax=Tetradesmus obliquus TaxID=3088 RepID=A0ABY8UPD4_TETOB|nr:hypothetical protein OEZ85_001524 [Tetradesmus obliquus]WIA43650.1 hypothetical protein OEZ86_010089 [Tetradesmus obliquus]
MFAVGVGNLVWGPLSDRFGRRITYGLSSVTFLGTTLGCDFSPNISVLVAMPALQGFAECAYLTNGQAVVADIFAPAQRGQALGVFMLSLLVGPVIGPLVGGALSQTFGWRSTFIFLAVCCGVMVPLLVMVPETQQYLVLACIWRAFKRVGAAAGTAAATSA